MTPPVNYVALVRNVMLGRGGIDRCGLVASAERVGATDVRSHLATGNLTLRFAGPVDELAAGLEAGVANLVGRHEMVAVRTRAQLLVLLSTNPYEGLDPAVWEMEVALLRHDAAPIDPAAIPDSRRTRVLAVHERELVTARPRDGAARPHVNPLLAQAAGQPVTARAWRTLERLVGRPA